MYRARGKCSIKLTAPWEPRDDPSEATSPVLDSAFLYSLFIPRQVFLLCGKLSRHLQVCRPKFAIYMETLRFGIYRRSHPWRWLDVQTWKQPDRLRSHDWWWGMDRLLKNVQIGREGNWYGISGRVTEHCCPKAVEDLQFSSRWGRLLKASRNAICSGPFQLENAGSFQRLDTKTGFEGTHTEKVMPLNCVKTKISLSHLSTSSEAVGLSVLVPQKAGKRGWL